MTDTPRKRLEMWRVGKLPDDYGIAYCAGNKLFAEDVMAIMDELAAANAENAVLRDAINDALPWMIKLGDYIGNGTQADPMGRCNAILKMRIAVEKRDD